MKQKVGGVSPNIDSVRTSKPAWSAMIVMLRHQIVIPCASAARSEVVGEASSRPFCELQTSHVYSHQQIDQDRHTYPLRLCEWQSLAHFL